MSLQTIVKGQIKKLLSDKQKTKSQNLTVFWVNLKLFQLEIIKQNHLFCVNLVLTLLLLTHLKKTIKILNFSPKPLQQRKKFKILKNRIIHQSKLKRLSQINV